MYEKILLKLKSQRAATSQVSDRTLEDFAKLLENLYTTDELLEKADFTTTLTSMDGNINFQAAEAVRKAKEVEKQQKDKDEAEKKRKNQSGQNPTTPPANPDDVPQWAQLLVEQTKVMADEIQSLKKEKSTTLRMETLKASLKDMPEYYTAPILAGFEKTNFENDDDFKNYVKIVEKQRDAFVQSAKENGLNNSFPPANPKKEPTDGQTSELSAARQIIKKQKEVETKKSE